MAYKLAREVLKDKRLGATGSSSIEYDGSWNLIWEAETVPKVKAVCMVFV